MFRIFPKYLYLRKTVNSKKIYDKTYCKSVYIFAELYSFVQNNIKDDVEPNLNSIIVSNNFAQTEEHNLRSNPRSKVYKVFGFTKMAESKDVYNKTDYKGFY